MQRFEPDRLTAEEATEVARLHTERVTSREAAEIAEREHFASTTGTEELASVLGATPDEVRQLTEEVRRAAIATTNGTTGVKGSGLRPFVLPIAVLVAVVLLVMLLALSVPPGR